MKLDPRTPDYSKYSDRELLEALQFLNAEKYPDRLEALQSELDSRKLRNSEGQITPSWVATAKESVTVRIIGVALVVVVAAVPLLYFRGVLSIISIVSDDIRPYGS